MMSFGEHLEELRTRLIFTVLGLVALFIVGLVVGDELLTLITQPLIEKLKDAGQPANLLATSPVEPFAAYIKVAFVATLIVGMPWALFQLWLFIAPGLHKQERRFVYVLLPMSAGLTALGIFVLYFVLLPISLLFLIRFGAGLLDTPVVTAPIPEGVSLPQAPVLDADPANPIPGSFWINDTLNQFRIATNDGVLSAPLSSGGSIAQQYRISEYINLVFILGVAFAIAFHLPLVLMLLSWVGLVEPKDLTPYRKHIIFACAAGSAMMPTQDPWSMLILTGCLYGLFEFGLVLMRWMPARRVAQGLSSTPDGDEEA